MKTSQTQVSSGTSPRDECLGLAQVLDRVADKWAIMVVGHLSEQPSIRFNELMRAIPGISHRMLTLTLRNLQREGLVSRTAFATVPPRVDYALTELGHSLKESLAYLASWARANRLRVEAARAMYDSQAEAGADTGTARAIPAPASNGTGSGGAGKA